MHLKRKRDSRHHWKPLQENDPIYQCKSIQEVYCKYINNDRKVTNGIFHVNRESKTKHYYGHVYYIVKKFV